MTESALTADQNLTGEVTSLPRQWREGSQRSLPRLALLLCVLLFPSCSRPDLSSRPDASGRPNVLFVSIDTLRADHLSVYGYERRTSPHLEKFAEEATVFENAYAQWPSTLHSHMSMFTSLFPQTHGVEKNRGLSPTIPLLAEIFQQAGYQTTGYYSLSWLDPKFGFARGFDRYQFKAGGEDVRDAALKILRKSEAVSPHPFFLFFHIRDVHCGPGLETRGKDLYTSPPQYQNTFVPHPEVEIPHLPMDIWQGKVRLTPKQLDNVIAHYDAGILHADAILHQTFEAMKEYGIFDDTLIVITSDHGEAIGDHGKLGHGAVWEEGLRVPLIIKLPSNHPERSLWHGKRHGYRVQSVDLAPTLLRLVDLPIPATHQGQDLIEPVERDILGQSTRASVLIQGHHKLKLIHKNRQMVLYDLKQDPEEQNPIGLQEPELVRSMGETLMNHLRANRARAAELSATQAPVQLGDDQLKKLESLGYIN